MTESLLGDLMVANQVAGQQQQLGIIVNQLHAVKMKLTESEMANQVGLSQLRSYCQHQFGLIHQTLGKMLHQAPTRRVIGGRPAGSALATGAAARARPVMRAGLAKCVKTLHDCWREWTDGLEMNKPASQLSRSERGGTVRFTYCLRKIVWDAIKKLTDKGITHLVAIERIEQAYGYGKPLSHYIQCLRRDKRTGGHPNLVDV